MRGDALFKGSVVERAAAPHHYVQRLLWGGREAQSLFLRLAASRLVHTYLFWLIGTKVARAKAWNRLTA
jgi:hypothetical protein